MDYFHAASGLRTDTAFGVQSILLYLLHEALAPFPRSYVPCTQYFTLVTIYPALLIDC